MQTKLVVKLDELTIDGYNNDYRYLLEEVETESYKEVNQLDITFFLDSLDELDTVAEDLEKIIIETSLKIEEIEEEQEERSEMDKTVDQHNYYMKNTI